MFEFNQLIHQEVLKALKVEINVTYTESYISENDKIYDFRTSIHPKLHLENKIKKLKYFQVFQEKQKFIPNLSIFDLLFNQGPMAKKLLLQ